MFILRSGLTSTASHPDRDFCGGGGRMSLHQLYLKMSNKFSWNCSQEKIVYQSSFLGVCEAVDLHSLIHSSCQSIPSFYFCGHCVNICWWNFHMLPESLPGSFFLQSNKVNMDAPDQFISGTGTFVFLSSHFLPDENAIIDSRTIGQQHMNDYCQK